MSAWIYGAGTSHFGKQRDTALVELAWQAAREALADAGEQPGAGQNIEAVFVGSVFGEPGVAQRVLSNFGIAGPPVLTFENACASGTTAFHEAVTAVEAGRYGRVLVLGLEKMSTLFDGPILPQNTDAEGRTGLAMPAIYAMSAARWLHEGRTTLEELASVSVKNHAHAMHNPRAQYRGEYSVRQVLDSPMICDPITLLQCSPISDGAAAVVVGADRGRPADVRVRASVLRSGGLWDHRSPDIWGYRLVHETAQSAYALCGIGPDGVDVAEVHDAFTIGELATVEALGLAPEGQAGSFAARGVTGLGGRCPVNPSGGLLSRGHPLGATGVAQIAELTWQLRGAAGPRQVPGARIGLVETMGGGVAGTDGNACVIAILEHNSPGGAPR